MEKVIILGTGNAGVKNCYNTCFALKNKNEYLLVDAGGGNGILKQLELAKIELSQITNMIVTHSHTDHVLGVVWIFRMVATKIKSGEYDGNFNIYCHDELVSTIKTIIKLTVQERLYNLIDERIFINEVQDGQKITICEHLVTFFDIYSTKAKQFGFSIELDDGKLTCLGDEPFNELCYQYAVDSKWLLSEAFCLYQERDFFLHTGDHHDQTFFYKVIPGGGQDQYFLQYLAVVIRVSYYYCHGKCFYLWFNLSLISLMRLFQGLSPVGFTRRSVMTLRLGESFSNAFSPFSRSFARRFS